MRGLYPSRNLQDWMRRNPRKATAFRERYLVEPAHNEAAVEKVCAIHKQRGNVTILTVPVEGPWDIHETLASVSHQCIITSPGCPRSRVSRSASHAPLHG